MKIDRTINFILLDCDGVLADFLSGALTLLNKEFGKKITLDEYVTYNEFEIEKVYGISGNDFWRVIRNDKYFWLNLKPFPWANKLLKELRKYAPVVVSTSPDNLPSCYGQKSSWLWNHLKIGSKDLMIGNRKYLMARPDHILIDDYPKNINKFIENGGRAIKVPSNWDTRNLSFDKVWSIIEPVLEGKQ